MSQLPTAAIGHRINLSTIKKSFVQSALVWLLFDMLKFINQTIYGSRWILRWMDRWAYGGPIESFVRWFAMHGMMEWLMEQIYEWKDGWNVTLLLVPWLNSGLRQSHVACHVSYRVMSEFESWLKSGFCFYKIRNITCTRHRLQAISPIESCLVRRVMSLYR